MINDNVVDGNFLLIVIEITRFANIKEDNLATVFFSTPSGARTLDPNIKSVVLYQLS